MPTIWKARPVEMEKREGRRVSPLAEAEREVLAEGREWMRRRLERKLQALADRQGAFSPSQRGAPAPLSSASDCADDERGEGGD